MSDLDGLSDLMLDEVTILTPSTSRNSYGASVGYSTVGTFACRYVGGASYVREQPGGDRLANAAVAWVASTVPLSTMHVAQVADVHRPIMMVTNYPDEVGHHHSRITFGTR